MSSLFGGVADATDTAAQGAAALTANPPKSQDQIDAENNRKRLLSVLGQSPGRGQTLLTSPGSNGKFGQPSNFNPEKV